MNFSLLKTSCLSGILLLILSMLYILYNLPIQFNQNHLYNSDFYKFYESNQLYTQNKNPYSTITIGGQVNHAGKSTLKLGTDLNPPFFQLLIFPFTRFVNFQTSLFIWNVLSIFGAGLSILLLLRGLNRENPSLPVFLGSLILLFTMMPTFQNFCFEQITFLLLPILTGAWYAAHQKNHRLSGILLGILASIKLFFGIFIFYFLTKTVVAIREKNREEDWLMPSFYFCGTIILCAFLPLLFFSPSIYQNYYETLHQVTWYSNITNGSLYGFAVRLFGIHHQMISYIATSPAARKTYYFFAGVFGLILIYVLKPDTQLNTEEKVNFDFSIILTGMLLLSPLGWSYYFPFLMIPIAFLFNHALKNHHPIPILSFIFIFLILTAGHHVENHTISHFLMWTKTGNSFLSLILLFSFLLYCNWKILPDPQTKEILTKRFVLPKNCVILIFILGFIPSLINMINGDNFFKNYKSHHYHIIKIQG
jgi:hypothetical protein